MKTKLIWHKHEPAGSVYAATQFYFATGKGGYLGG